MDTKDFFVGTYTKSRMSNAPVLPVSIPVLEDNAVKAVVITGVRLDWLQNRIRERGVAPGNAVTIADGNGTILARVPLPEQFVGTVIPKAYLPLVHADRPDVFEVRSLDGTERILGYRPVALPVSPLYVSAGFSKADAFAPINRTTLTNVLAIAGGALLSFLAAVLIGNRFLLAPISRIADVMERWRRGETGARTGMAAADELSNVGSTLDSLLDELEDRRRRNEEADKERAVLLNELAHRVKNGFALVQAIARQTFSRAEPNRYHSFSNRLTALASTYDLLLTRNAMASSVQEVLKSAARAHSGERENRIGLDGPDVDLSPDLALPLSLVIHELATNATKYGSLGSDTGKVAVEWKEEGNRLYFVWTESGGPRVDTPSQRGFGSVLIEKAFPSKAQSSSRSEFRPEGLRFELVFNLVEPERNGAVLKER